MIKEPTWVQATCATWVTVEVAGKHIRIDTVRGYCRPLAEMDLGVSLVRDSRWALGFYKDPAASKPFFIMPGCQVRNLQLLTDATDSGFIEWIETEPAKGSFQFVGH